LNHLNGELKQRLQNAIWYKYAIEPREDEPIAFNELDKEQIEEPREKPWS